MKTNKQSERSRRWITDALFDLMKLKPFSEITVKDLTEAAGVSRLTFYRHFNSREEILTDAVRQNLDILWQELKEEDEKNGLMSLREVLIRCVRHFEGNRERIRTISGCSLQDILVSPVMEFLDKVLTDYGLADVLVDCQKSFLVGGFCMALLEWAAEEKTMEVETMKAEQLADRLMEIIQVPEVRAERREKIADEK